MISEINVPHKIHLITYISFIFCHPPFQQDIGLTQEFIRFIKYMFDIQVTDNIFTFSLFYDL